jgi:hypothetical protein
MLHTRKNKKKRANEMRTPPHENKAGDDEAVYAAG